MKLFRNTNMKDFEHELNLFLEKISNLELVDIKYTSTYEGLEEVFSTSVIYKEGSY